MIYFSCLFMYGTDNRTVKDKEDAMGRADRDMSWSIPENSGVSGASHAQGKAQPLERKKVLILDKDVSAREVARDVLERYGLAVVACDHESCALFACSKPGSAFRLALVDESFIASGDVLSRLQTLYPSMNIIVTGCSSAAWDSHRIMLQGASGFLRKPYRVMDLLKTVERFEQFQ
jgi:response regulator RpfG family c-di-GMP phosphodiesterase